MWTLRKMKDTCGAWASSGRGNVAMISALSVIPLMLMAGFAIDYQRTITAKGRVQAALDSAVLAAAKSLTMGRSPADATADANAYFQGILSQRNGGWMVCPDPSIAVDTVEYEIDASVRCSNETTLMKLGGRDQVDFSVNSSTTYGLGSIEVALILDTTGSMSGWRIGALRDAANDFIDIVIRDEQVPFYSKASIVPYSVAINAGAYAQGLRGPIVPGRSISNAAWQDGPQRSVSGVTRASPAVVTSDSHGLSNGDRIWISGVSGMTQINNQVFTVAGATANSFQLQGVNSTGFSSYSSGGIIRKCLEENCEVRLTATGHGLANNDHAVIQGINGMTQINTGAHATWRVSNVTANTFALQNSVGPNYSSYSSGGTAFCTTLGCEFYRFLNRASNAQRVHRISTCVTERSGVHAFTDVSPSTALLGYNYPSTNNPCTNVVEFMPLSSNKPALKAKVNALSAGGSTAGHLGITLGWYTLSPNFGYLFPVISRPAGYNTPRLFKIAVLMTDGEFNTAYCNGVIARDSTSGSGSANDQINCDSNNGHSFPQSLAYCTAMKQAGLIIYTIGFEIEGNASATELVNECATSPGHVHMATGGDELRDVFQRIALSINDIRLTR